MPQERAGCSATRRCQLSMREPQPQQAEKCQVSEGSEPLANRSGRQDIAEFSRTQRAGRKPGS